MNNKIEIVYGHHAVQHMLSQSPHLVLEVFVAKNRKSSARRDALLRHCEEASISLQYIAPAKLDKLTQIKDHQGIAAKCRVDKRSEQATISSLCEAKPHRFSIILLLDGVMDPGNLGACIRTANAAGVTAVLLPKDRAAGVNATVKKAASGATEGMAIITVTNVARTLRQLREAGYWVVGAAEDAAETMYRTAVTFPAVLVMGSEDKGLRQNTRKQCDRIVKIPMYGSVESLNVAAAASVCLYELVRQREYP